MRFEYYTDKLADVPKLSVDGTVANAVHFSHWQGNETPASVKADTSTEIALNLAAAPLLQSLVSASQNYGIELDANTLRLVQQAQEAGVAFKTDPMERMVQVLEAIAIKSPVRGSMTTTAPRGGPE